MHGPSSIRVRKKGFLCIPRWEFQGDKKQGSNTVAKSKGTVKFFNQQKGFGFITPDNGGKELFVHASNIQGDVQSVQEGTKVEYLEGPGRKGPEATQVSIL
jgi:CspA family cold shock protein